MSTALKTFLAVGASGKCAGLVVPELARRGVTVRGFVRHASQGDAVRERGAQEIAIGDLNDGISVAAALRGVDGVFYLAPAFMPGEADAGVAFVEATRRAGVRRIVFSSVIHPTLASLSNHAAKAPVEQAIFASGLDYAVLQPALFFQNFADAWANVVKTGVHAEPWSSETRFSRVDYRDVAEVAAIALTEDRLLAGTFELCAEGPLDRHGVARLMSEVLGKPIDAARPPAVASARATQDVAADAQASALQPMFDWYDRHSVLGNPLVLRSVLGHEARSLKAYFEELAAGHVKDGQ